MRPLVAHCHLGLARLERQSKRNETRQHFATASAMYREMGMQFWLEQATIESRGLGTGWSSTSC
jgi:hypothetical protein